MGDFCEKSDFSPLKVENTLNIFPKSEKNSLAGPGPVGRGVNNMEKNFFAFLDELDHLEDLKRMSHFCFSVLTPSPYFFNM